jgi:hypothetical protein
VDEDALAAVHVTVRERDPHVEHGRGHRAMILSREMEEGHAVALDLLRIIARFDAQIHDGSDPMPVRQVGGSGPGKAAADGEAVRDPAQVRAPRLRALSGR